MHGQRQVSEPLPAIGSNVVTFESIHRRGREVHHAASGINLSLQEDRRKLLSSFGQPLQITPSAVGQRRHQVSHQQQRPSAAYDARDGHDHYYCPTFAARNAIVALGSV